MPSVRLLQAGGDGGTMWCHGVLVHRWEQSAAQRFAVIAIPRMSEMAPGRTNAGSGDDFEDRQRVRVAIGSQNACRAQRQRPRPSKSSRTKALSDRTVV